MSDEAERIAALFLGCELGYGTYKEETRTPGKLKSEIKATARTVRGPTTLDMWRKHLDGITPLGVIPIREDGMCYWGVIDVDKYDSPDTVAQEQTPTEIAAKIQSLGLPLIVCKSKSGGAHLFLFLSTPMAAADLIAKLKEYASILGYGGSEIFPKQTKLLVEKGDLGNWLNMPYFNREQNGRYAITSTGQGLSLKRFLDAAYEIRKTAQQVLALKPKVPDSAPDFSDGPPCIQHLSAIGVEEGGRNNALFGFGVLAKRMKPDNWENLLEKWNRDHFKPPLSSDELQLVMRSLRKKDYTYKCKDVPLANHCDQTLCRMRRFGIGAAVAPAITSISILDAIPAIYFVSLEDGTTIECSIDDLLTPRAFQRTVLMQARKLLPLYKQDTFLNKIGELVENATLIDAPKEISPKGRFKDLLDEFLTDQYAAKTFEEILLGKPFLNDEDGNYWFRYSDLGKFLAKEKFQEFTNPQVWNAMRGLGGDTKYKKIHGKGVNLWYLSQEKIERQVSSFYTPKVEDSPV